MGLTKEMGSPPWDTKMEKLFYPGIQRWKNTLSWDTTKMEKCFNPGVQRWFILGFNDRKML